MPKKEYELGGYVVYIPDGAKINIENKQDSPPKTKYSERESVIDENVTKKLCGGKYGKDNN